MLRNSSATYLKTTRVTIVSTSPTMDRHMPMTLRVSNANFTFSVKRESFLEPIRSLIFTKQAKLVR